MEGITIEGDRLLQDNTVVGRVSIEAADGASGQHVATSVPPSRVDAPVTGIPAGHLRVLFRAGSESGTYRVRFALNRGNAVRQVVAVK